MEVTKKQEIKAWFQVQRDYKGREQQKVYLVWLIKKKKKKENKQSECIHWSTENTAGRNSKGDVFNGA